MFALTICLLALSRTALANTCYDSFGNPYHCNGHFSIGARIAIGIGIALAIGLVGALFAARQRRNTLYQNRTYAIGQQSTGVYPQGGTYDHGQWNDGAHGYGQSPYVSGANNAVAGAPTYPPPSHNHGGYAPPPGPPPPPVYTQHDPKYPPPPGPPPA